MGKTTLYVEQQPGRSFHVIDQAEVTTGNVFFVDDSGTDSVGRGRDSDDPFATLDYAISQCTADQGDTIYVMPGHAETVTGDGGLGFDVAGVSVIGLGWGADRPTILVDGSTGADIEVSADDFYIENLIILSGHSDQVECFDMGEATDFTVVNCEFRQNAADENFKILFNLSGTNNHNDGLTIIGCKYICADTANVEFVKFNKDCARFTMKHTYVGMGVNDNATILGCEAAVSLFDCVIIENYFHRLNTATSNVVIDSNQADNSGIVALNACRHAYTTGEAVYDVSGARLFENFSTGAADASGYFVPGADT